MSDSILDELHQQQSIIEIKTRERKIEIARGKGEVVNSLDDLICSNHSGAKFKVIGTIPDSILFTMGKEGKKGLNIYQCEPCGNDGILHKKSKAYDCPNCGIVLGKFEERHYKSSIESWQVLAGREGKHYHCRVCDAQLGSQYFKFS